MKSLLKLVMLLSIAAMLLAACGAQETQAPTEVMTEPPTEVMTEAPTEVATEAPTEAASLSEPSVEADWYRFWSGILVWVLNSRVGTSLFSAS